jgi:hypothetical protein
MPNPERDVKIRDPKTGTFLPPNGTFVPANMWWHRRLRDRDIVIVPDTGGIPKETNEPDDDGSNDLRDLLSSPDFDFEDPRNTTEKGLLDCNTLSDILNRKVFRDEADRIFAELKE